MIDWPVSFTSLNEDFIIIIIIIIAHEPMKKIEIANAV
jgi:hypothetical protein